MSIIEDQLLPPDYLPGEGAVWTVVGGSDSGGITVRRGRSLKTEELKVRLEHGARVEQVRLVGDRLHYRRLEGEGPDFGWVSLCCKGAPLLKKDTSPARALAHTLEELPRSSVPPLAPLLEASQQKRRARWSKELPPESAKWTHQETELFVASGGWYHPTQMAQRRRDPMEGRVSVVTPTSEARQSFHEQLWACFEAQHWQDKELIIIETYTNFVSSFLASRARRSGSHLIHVACRGDMSIGLKRNVGVHLASGSYIVHFDDDDLYAPGYITKMVSTLRERDLAALTLSAWYNCELGSGSMGFVDPEAHRPHADEGLDAQEATKAREARRRQVELITYGYGFSYAYLREPALAHPFPDVSMGEDFEFLLRLRHSLGEQKVGLLEDHSGICVHVLHHHNSAGSESDRVVPLDEVKSLAVRGLDIIDPRLQILLVGLSRKHAVDVLAALRFAISEPVTKQRLERLRDGQFAAFVLEHLYPKVCADVGLPRDSIWPKLLFDTLDRRCEGDRELGAAMHKLQVLLNGRRLPLLS